MEIVGVVAEYNPFHRGHAHHLAETRRMAGEDAAIVCALSGDFVQRGEAAAFSKHARAEAACRCGADLVIELPLPWALSSAEGFARGAMSLLGALGCTGFSFGSEAGESEALEEIARELIDPRMQGRIHEKLQADASLSYAAARQRAVADRLDGDRAKLLEQPNNILAVEYLKALFDLRLDMKPMTVRREGSAHDGVGGTLKSARELRQRLYSGREIDGEVPKAAAEIYAREQRLGRALPDRQIMETAMLSRLRALNEEDYVRLPDAGEGLGLRLFRAARTEPTIDRLFSAAATKRYALSRIRRMLCCAALGVTAQDTAGLPPYARVLAATERGCAVLRRAEERGGLPILSKPASVRELSEECLHVFELGARAHDLWVLGLPAVEERCGGGDWRSSPVILK